MKKIEDWDSIKVPKQLKHYDVYYEGHGSGCYAENYKKVFITDVWARTDKEACNIARYSLRDEKNPHGGYSIDILGDYMEEGMVLFEYKAYEIK